jgi:glutathione synthase/RimK-type ligase-like ATP-grasp enzyme
MLAILHTGWNRDEAALRELEAAATAVSTRGLPVVLGGRAEGGAVIGRRFVDGAALQPGPVHVHGCWHRFADHARPIAWRKLRRGLRGALILNPPKAVDLCRDKLRCQRFLEARGVAQPEVSGDVGAFPALLRAWGAAFLKPRGGSMGRDVVLLRAGDPLPTLTPGAWVLQRAVAPPAGFAAMCARVLIQREPEGTWWVAPIAVRTSHDQPVANHARGAAVHDAADLLPASAVERLLLSARRVAEAFAQHPGGDLVAELGVDLVLDPDLREHVIEVNGKPRSSVRALAAAAPDRYAQALARARELPLLRIHAVAAARARG